MKHINANMLISKRLSEAKVPSTIREWRLLRSDESAAAEAACALRRLALSTISEIYRRLSIGDWHTVGIFPEDVPTLVRPAIAEANLQFRRIAERYPTTGVDDTEGRAVWRWLLADTVLEATGIDRKTYGGADLEKAILGIAEEL